MAYGSGLIQDFWTGYKQKKRDRQELSRNEMYGLTSGLTAGELEARKQSTLLQMETDKYNKQMEMKKKEQEAAEDAARVQGLVNVGGLYGQYKVGMAGAEATKAALAGSAGAGGAASGGAAAAATGATEGAATSGIATAGGGLAQSGATIGGAELTTFPSGHAAVAELTGASSSAGGGSALGALAAPGAMALGAGLLTTSLLQKQSDLVQGVASAAVSGAVMAYMLAGTTIGGPVGFLIGAVIGGVASLVDDVSVICSELDRQGLMDKEMLKWSERYVRLSLDRRVYWAYRKHGDAIVPWMRRSKIVTYLMLPFGRALARECASRACHEYKSSWLGRQVEKYLIWYVKRQHKKSEVRYAISR